MDGAMWVAVAATLVAGMQIGFLFLEAGFVRSKNSINVALKNIADFVLAVVAFCFFGAAIMFASDSNGIFGFESALAGYDDDGTIVLFILFQAFFCGTAATIVSGAIAERTHFLAYLLLTIPLTALIYPVVGHWAWASELPGGSGEGWLEAMGFVDFAGSTVVHATGGAAALAVLMVIGQREGRFVSDRVSNAVHGHSPVLSGAGALMLLVGWMGFNTGTLTPGSDDFARALANTIFAAAAGCLSACATGRAVEGYYRSDRLINGMLIGLVAITASAPFASATGALLLGACAGAFSVVFANWLEYRHKIDDAVYAVTVHGMGGILGTLAVPLVMRPEYQQRSLADQLTIQAIGTTVVVVTVFAGMLCLAKLMQNLGKLRVSPADEQRGLNFTEHGALMGSAALVDTLKDINKGAADLSSRIEYDPFEDGSEVAAAVNMFLDRVEIAEREADAQIQADQVRLAQMAESERNRANETETLLKSFQGEFATLVAELKQQAGELANGSQDLASRTDQSGQLVTDVSRRAEKTVEMAEQMSQGSTLLAETLQLVGEKVSLASRATNRAEDASRKGAEMAATLESSTREIGKLVGLIKAISDKTGMISVNARIEAARAGEAGRGFTVVSQEVGDLAAQVDAASSDIAQIVNSLVDLIGNSIAQFRAIDGDIATVKTLSEEAEQSAAAQRETTEKLSDLIDEAKRQALGNGAAVSQVSQNFTEADLVIGTIENSSRALDKLAQRIDAEVQKLHQRMTESGKIAEQKVSA